MQFKAPSAIANTIEILLMLCCAAIFIQNAYIISATLFYPYDLNFLEGGVIENISRLWNGKSIYAEPSLEYVPYIYTPLYNYLVAASALILGEVFAAGRIVSILSVFGMAWVIYSWTSRENISLRYRIIALGLFFATFELTDEIMYAARVDSTATFLFFLGAYILYFFHTVRFAIAAGLILALCFFCKQTFLFPILILIVWKICIRPMQGVLCTGCFILLLAAGILWFQYSSDNWFSFYAFYISSSGFKRPLWQVYDYFVQVDLLAAFGCTSFLALFGMLYFFSEDKKRFIFYGLLLVGCVGISFCSRVHSGGSTNVLMPAYYSIIILGVLFLYNVACGRVRVISLPMFHSGLLFALLIQFSLLQFDTSFSVPNEDDRKGVEKLLATIKSFEGEVFVPERCFIQKLVGKKSHAFSCMGAYDIYAEHRQNEVSLKRIDELLNDIKQHRFSAIIMDSSKRRSLVHITNPEIWNTIMKHYKKKEVLFEEDDGAMWPVWGFVTRPDTVYVPDI